MGEVQIESEQISDQVFKMYNGPAVDITIVSLEQLREDYKRRAFDAVYM